MTPESTGTLYLCREIKPGPTNQTVCPAAKCQRALRQQLNGKQRAKRAKDRVRLLAADRIVP